MLIIAHRGASGTYPENTKEAFLAAAELGARAVETDVRRCVCGGLALSHDPVLAYEQCATLLHFKDFLNIKISGAYLPLSAMDVCLGEQLGLYAEIKERGIAEELFKATKDLLYFKNIVFSSFLWKELWTLRRLSARARIGMLWEPEVYKIPKCVVAFLGKFLFRAESIHVDLSMVKEKDFVSYFRKKRFLVYAYTANSYEDAHRAWRIGFDGVFTDVPGYIAESLEEMVGATMQ